MKTNTTVGQKIKYILFWTAIVTVQMFGEEVSKTVSSIHWSVDDVAECMLTDLTKDMKTQVGDVFRSEVFDEDVRMLYQTFDEITPQFSLEEDNVAIVIDASLRPMIKEIRWSSQRLFLTITKSELLEHLNVLSGSRLDRSKLLWGIRSAEKWLSTKGYSSAKIHVSESFVTPTEIVLSYHVDLGYLHYFRAIKTVGLDQSEQSLFDSVRNTQSYDPVSAVIFGWGIYDERKIEQDRFSLLRILRDSGYADAQVEARIIHGKKGALTLAFLCDKGVKYRLRNVQILSEDDFQINHMLRKHGIFSGAVFSRARLMAVKTALQELYGSHGYVEAAAQVRFSVIDEHGSDVDLAISVTQGERLRVRDILVIGNTQTDNDYILDMCPVASLDYFNTYQLNDSRIALLQTRLFEDVQIYPSEQNDNDANIPGFRDLIIDVKEQATGNLALGMSYGSETSWRATLELSDANFNAQGLFHLRQRGTRALRGQGEQISLALSMGNRFADAKGSFFKQRVLGTNWGYGFDFSFDRTERGIVPVDISRKGLGGRIARRIGLSNALILKGRVEGVQSSTSEASTMVSNQAKNEVDSDFLLHAFGLEFSTDRVMGNGFYLSGWRASAESELLFTKGNLDAGQQMAIKLTLSSSLYLPFLKGILKMTTYGAGLSVLNGMFDTLPYPERFFTDQHTVSRGWRERSIGSRIVDEFGNPTAYAKGGDRMLSSSCEYAFPMTKELAFFTFFDWSYLSLGNSVSISQRERQVQASIGYGMHVGSILGIPVSFGFGYPVVQALRAEDLSNFFFSLGKTF